MLGFGLGLGLGFGLALWFGLAPLGFSYGSFPEVRLKADMIRIVDLFKI